MTCLMGVDREQMDVVRYLVEAGEHNSSRLQASALHYAVPYQGTTWQKKAQTLVKDEDGYSPWNLQKLR